MAPKNHLFIGTDSGATTSKIGVVLDLGKPVSWKLLQHPTNWQQGAQAEVEGWIEATAKSGVQRKVRSIDSS